MTVLLVLSEVQDLGDVSSPAKHGRAPAKRKNQAISSGFRPPRSPISLISLGLPGLAGACGGLRGLTGLHGACRACGGLKQSGLIKIISTYGKIISTYRKFQICWACGGLWGTTGLVGLVGHLKYTDTTLPGLLRDRYLLTVTSKSHVRSICPPLTTVYWGLKHPPGTLAISVCVYPSNRRSLAMNRAATRGAPPRVGNLQTIPTTPCIIVD